MNDNAVSRFFIAPLTLIFSSTADVEKGKHELFLCPIADCSGKITSEFGNRKDPIIGRLSFHCGIDIKGEKGTSVMTPYFAEVTKVEYDGGDNPYGNMVELTHYKDDVPYLKTLYAHLDSIAVSQEQILEPKTKIGYIGNTGRLTGPHLHFEVKSYNNWMQRWRSRDPALVIPSKITRPPDPPEP